MFDKDGLININPSPHGPHQIIPQEIKPHKIILDIGCNTGMLGQMLSKNNIIDGIDINKKALKIASVYYRHLFNIDVSNPKNIHIKQKYDYIIMSDILEHLPHPNLLLSEIKKLLKPHGFIICSLPNIARFEIRLQLLLGKFEYTPAGILNQDHLRFFTKKSAIDLFSQTGYKVVKIIPTGLAHSTGILPNLTAFQFIYKAVIAK